MTHFDDFIKKTLNRHSTPVDTDKIWAGIQNKRSNRRRYGMIISLFAGLALFVIALAFKPTTTTEDVTGDTAVAQVTDVNEETDLVLQEVDVQLAAKPETTIQPLDNETPTPVPNPTAKPSGDEIKPSENLQRIDDVNVKKALVKPMAVKEAGYIALPARELLSPIQSIDENASMLTWEGPALSVDDTWDKKGKSGCYPKKSNFDAFIGAYAAPVYRFNTFETDSPEFNQYIDARESTESYLEGFSIGAFAGVRHTSGLSLQGGLHYTQLNEKFELNETRIDTIGELAVTGYVLNPSGDTTFIQETVYRVEERRFSKKTYNSYRLIDVPILLGYEWGAGKWYYTVQGGVSLNLWFSQKGEIFDEGQQIVDLENNQSNGAPIYKDKVGLGIMGSVGVGYRLGNGVDLFARPYFRHFTKPITHEDYVLRQNVNNAGIKFGLRWNLGNP